MSDDKFNRDKGAIGVIMGADGRKAIAAFLFLATGAALGFGCNLLWARMLGPSGTGAILLGVAIVGVGATLGRAGIDSVVLREASIIFRRNDMQALRVLHRDSCVLVVGLGLVVTLTMWLALPRVPFGEDMRSALRTAMPILLLGLPGSALLILQGEFLKACGASALGTFSQVALVPLLIVLALVAAAVVTDGSIALVAWVQSGATCVAAAWALLAARRRLPTGMAPAATPTARALLRAGAPFLWVAGVNLVMTWTDILVLGVLSDSPTVGVYGVAARVSSLMTFILTAANSVTAPQFATLESRGERSKLQRVAQSSTLWMTVAALPILVILLVWPRTVLGLFGNAFAEGASSLQILVVGQFVNVAVGSVGFLLMMTGHERVLRNVILFAAAGNLIGNLALVPRFGAVGAATATAFSVIVLNVTALWQVRRRIGINTLGYLVRHSDAWPR